MNEDCSDGNMKKAYTDGYGTWHKPKSHIIASVQ